MTKIISIHEAAGLVKEGMTVMCGGYLGLGAPNRLLQAVIRRGTKNLTVICNDSGVIGSPLEKLLTNGQIGKLIASHIGSTPEVGRRMTTGELLVELIPQGTLAERIRAGGAGLGGFLTETGFGTTAAEGKEIITVNGKPYLLETPLHADIALLNGHKVDRSGNIWYRGTTRNFNVVMATAADLVIAEADNLVEIGAIEPENVVTQGILVDYITSGETEHAG